METFSLANCMAFVSCSRVVTASVVERPATDPH